MKSVSKYKHFKSKTHSWIENFIIMRYIILNPNFDEVDEKTRKYVNNYNKIYEVYQVRCLLKMMTTTNCVRYIRIRPQPNLYYAIYAPNKSILSKNKSMLTLFFSDK